MNNIIIKIEEDGQQLYIVNGVPHRIDGPAIVNSNGDIGWYQNGKLHRTDGPALISSNGDKGWYQNGVPHRLDGPAYISTDGSSSWFIHNQLIFDWQQYQQLSGATDEELIFLKLKYGQVRRT